jgi:predicted nucleotidyltransferase component of viral defense system
LDVKDLAFSAGFSLAGGTSLALRLGHRLTVDLDFFTTGDFSPSSLSKKLGFGPETLTGMAEGTLQCRIQNVKVEFLRHNYPQLAEPDTIQGVVMWSIPDVAAMKLNAICNRGSKKDFYDIAALLDHFPLQILLDRYQTKYRPASLMMVIRNLAWFEDADAEPDPISLCGESWPAVTDKISAAIRALE